MNKVILMGRLTRDPEVRYSAGENALAIARYTLAVDRRFRRDGEASADFIPVSYTHLDVYKRQIWKSAADRAVGIQRSESSGGIGDRH